MDHLRLLLDRLRVAKVNVRWINHHLDNIFLKRKFVIYRESRDYFEFFHGEYLRELRVEEQKLRDMGSELIWRRLNDDADRSAYSQACVYFDEVRDHLNLQIQRADEQLQHLRDELIILETRVEMQGISRQTLISAGLFGL